MIVRKQSVKFIFYHVKAQQNSRKEDINVSQNICRYVHRFYTFLSRMYEYISDTQRGKPVSIEHVSTLYDISSETIGA